MFNILKTRFNRLKKIDLHMIFNDSNRLKYYLINDNTS